MYDLNAIATASTSLLGFYVGINTALGGWLGILFLIPIWAVFTLLFQRSTERIELAVAASSFISMILAILLRASRLLTNDLVLYLTLILLAFTVAGGLWASRTR